MKKIMIMLGAVALAFGVQAATVTWNMTNVYGPDGSTLNSGKAYMFAYAAGSDSVTASTIAAAIAGAYSAGTLDSYLSDNSVYSWTPGTAGTYSDTSKSVDPEADMGLTAGSSYTFYSVVFDSTTIDDESMFFVTKELANKKVPASSANLLLSFGTQATASTAAGAWQNVPEPTSGLLMLVGLAGLALRRRRA